LEIGLREKNRFSNDNRDWNKVQTAASTPQSFMRTKDPHWHDWGERLCDHESHPGLSRLQVAVKRPRTFWKNQRCVSRL
jgi:hypothetical protein